MNDNYLDREFLELIENGSRHELAMYRNRIIDEQKFRTKQNRLGFTPKEQKNIKRRYQYAAFIFSVFIVIGVALVIVSLINGEIFSAVLNALVVVINILNVLIYRQKQKIANMLFLSEIVISANDVDKGKIHNDTDEMLEKKKARLDEVLGL